MLLLYFTTCQLFILFQYIAKDSSSDNTQSICFLYISLSFNHLLNFFRFQNCLLQRLHSPYASYIFHYQSFTVFYYITIDSAAETVKTICFLQFHSMLVIYYITMNFFVEAIQSINSICISLCAN